MAAPLGLKDSFTEEGYWWVPGAEDKQVAGTLMFDPENRTVLKLLGVTRDLDASLAAVMSGGHRPDDTIYGVTKKGKPVTLLRALNVQTSLNMPGIPTETWKSNLLVIGLHLSDEDKDDVFGKSYVRFDGIEQWLGHWPFTRDYDFEQKRLTIIADKPRETPFAEHTDFKVTSVGSIYSSNEPETHYSVEFYSQLGIEPSSPKSLNWHLSRAVRLQELASLCTGHHLTMLGFELQGPEEKIGDTVRPVEVHLYSALVNDYPETRPKHETPLISGHELVSFNSGAVQSWFDQYEIFNPAISLFFTVTGQKQMFTNIRLLLAIQALEVFHRRTVAAGIMSDEDFASFYDQLVGAVPDPRNKRMKEKLLGTCRYLNELSLGQRLRAIVADLTTSFGHTPPAFSKRNIRRLVDTRNYYTHFSRELEGKRIQSGSEMYWATRRIVLLLSLLFLQRLGVAAADLSRLLERHQEFSRLWVTEGEPF
jgi:hypothetical protein